LDPPRTPPGAVAELIVGAYDSADGLTGWRGRDVVTLSSSRCRRHGGAAGRPRGGAAAAGALEVAQDRHGGLFAELGIRQRRSAIGSQAELEAGPLPEVLNSALGYDGRASACCAGGRAEAVRGAGRGAADPEGLVEFDRELPIVAVRAAGGGWRAIRWSRTTIAWILRITHAPAPETGATLQELADRYARLVLERLEYVGVLALELFQVGDRLLANEMAPRVHNSGHWTIEGAETSQFENHLRAVCGLPLGSTALRMPCTMVNLIGAAPATAELAAIPYVHVHLYGKAPRPGRKVGHVTVTRGGDWEAAAALADAV
jgi:5-(carboxyamino)imidazole ribonucleotide synthase